MKRDFSFLRGVLVTIGVFAVMVLALNAGLNQVDSSNTERQTAALKDAVLHATLTCYAIEGRYPSDTGVLEAHYGLRYDHDRYIVAMDSFADNLLPDIRVLTVGGDADE